MFLRFISAYGIKIMRSKIEFFIWLSCRILVPWPGTEPRPQQWMRQRLTIGLPGNSQNQGLAKSQMINFCWPFNYTSLVAQTVKRRSTMWETQGSIPGLGRFPGEGNGNPLQYSCLENPMDGGAWCRLQGRARLSNLTFTLTSTIHF